MYGNLLLGGLPAGASFLFYKNVWASFLTVFDRD
jgi:hypothetical protein